MGDNIETRLEIKLTDALLGCSAEVNTPVGSKKLKIPAAVKPGTKIRLKGLGFNEGDLFAVINYSLPDKLNDDQLKAIESLKTLGL